MVPGFSVFTATLVVPFHVPGPGTRRHLEPPGGDTRPRQGQDGGCVDGGCVDGGVHGWGAAWIHAWMEGCAGR